MSIIQRIKACIEAQQSGQIQSSAIYIIDRKHRDGGSVQILDQEPDMAYILLKNEPQIEVVYVAFMDNALKVNTPQGQVEQCEAVLFPASMADENWFLFVETKYAADFKAALASDRNYPDKMINQIISTVGYFRDKAILAQDKQVQAIIAFPNLLEPFSEALFARAKLDQATISIQYRITLKAVNEGDIRSPKRLKL